MVDEVSRLDWDPGIFWSSLRMGFVFERLRWQSKLVLTT